MTLQPLPRPAAPPLGAAQVEDEAERLAAALLARLICDTPRRAATMTRAGAAKYRDVPGHAFTAGDMLDHLRGARTWAVTLASRDGCALAGCRDYDAGGAVVVVEALRAAAALGLVAFGILMPGAQGEHDGGHVWTLYRRPAPVADIRHQLAQLPGERGEIYPSGNAVRLPLGRHIRKATRGTLVLQDGRRFELDRGAELTAAVRALVALQRNAAPPAAPPEACRKLSAGGAPLDPAAWEGVTAEQGAALMASARYRALFGNPRRQLFHLQAGRRIVITTDAGPDDTGSQQLAALVSNLLTTGRSPDRKSDIVPGLGAPPLAEVRAVALHWRAALRPEYPIGAYQLDVDRLIAKYTPARYEPEPTRIGAPLGAPAPALPELPPATRRGRPRGAQAAQVERCAALLAPGALVTRAGLATALGCTPRTVTTLLSTLRAAGRVELAAEARGLRVVRVENNSTLAECAEGGSVEPFTASGRAEGCRENTRAPLAPPLGAPAAGDAAALGDDRPAPATADTAQGAEVEPLCVAGHPMECAAPPAPAAPECKPMRLAELEPAARLALVARIDDAAARIRAEVVTRVFTRGRRAGEVEQRRPRATRAAVGELLPDVPAALLGELWSYRGSWQHDAERLAATENPQALYAELRKVRDARDRAGKPAPVEWQRLSQAERERLAAKHRHKANDDAGALLLAEAQRRRECKRHADAVQARKRNERLERQIESELRGRGLPTTPPNGRPDVGRRGKAPSAAVAAQVEQQQRAEQLAALDRLMGRAERVGPRNKAAGRYSAEDADRWLAEQGAEQRPAPPEAAGDAQAQPPAACAPPPAPPACEIAQEEPPALAGAEQRARLLARLYALRRVEAA